MVSAVIYSWKGKGRCVTLMDGTPVQFVLINGIAIGYVGKGHLKEVLEKNVGCCGQQRKGFRLATEKELIQWKGEK